LQVGFGASSPVGSLMSSHLSTGRTHAAEKQLILLVVPISAARAPPVGDAAVCGRT
jgi:hypothetical protein